MRRQQELQKRKLERQRAHEDKGKAAKQEQERAKRLARAAHRPANLRGSRTLTSLSAAGQSRVTLSLRRGHIFLKSGLWATAGGKRA